MSKEQTQLTDPCPRCKGWCKHLVSNTICFFCRGKGRISK